MNQEHQRVHEIFYYLVSNQEFNKLEEFIEIEETSFVNHYRGFIKAPIRAVHHISLNGWKKLYSLGILGEPESILRGFVTMFNGLFSFHYNQDNTHDDLLNSYTDIWIWLLSLCKDEEIQDVFTALTIHKEQDKQVYNWFNVFKTSLRAYGELQDREVDIALSDLVDGNLSEKQAAFLLGMVESGGFPYFKAKLEDIAQLDKCIKLL